MTVADRNSRKIVTSMSSTSVISATTTATSGQKSLYFAYGSNMSLTQMSERCPNSRLYEPCPAASLTGYEWVINTRKFATLRHYSRYPYPGGDSAIVDQSGDIEAKGEEERGAHVPEGHFAIGHVVDGNEVSKVYGILYELGTGDEDRLDRYEGVPGSYQKHNLSVEVLGAGGVEVKALVYIDGKRQGLGKPREEYIRRLRNGLGHAIRLGVPSVWREVVELWL